MPQSYRVFLSAVSRECGQARGDVASDLRARGLLVKEQEDFRQEVGAQTTLQKLHDYIRDCDAVVAVVGARSGAFPSDEAARPFAALLPEGFTRLSYTQWEVVFAQRHGRRLSFYVAARTFVPEQPPGDSEDGAAQAAFAAWLFITRDLDRTAFDNKDALRAAVLREDWPHLSQPRYVHPRFRTLGALFKGRDDDMARLRELLAKGAAAIGSRTPAIHGLGGIGKTRLALEYGLAHEGDYDALIFLSGETPEQLTRDVVALTGALRLDGLDGKDEAARIAAAIDWLKAHPRWFLVIDNLDTPEAFKAADDLLGRLSGGDIVITTRLGRFDARFQKLDLDVLTVEAAAAFLLERTDADRVHAADDAATAEAIARDLGQLALALEQAGAQIAAMGWSLARYRKEWEANRDKALAYWDESVTAYPRAVAQTWATSVAQQSDDANGMLKLLAMLAPEPVPRLVLETPIPGAPPPEEAVAELRRFSLVSFGKDGQGFQMHRLVQEVTRRGMAEEQREAARFIAADWLARAVGEVRPGHADMIPRRSLLIGLSAHGEALAVGDPPSDAAAFLLAEVGDAYVEVGLGDSARRAQTLACDLGQRLVETDPGNARFQRDLSVSWERLGDLAVAAGDGKAAREAFERALAVRQRLAAADPGNAQFQRDLSMSWSRFGDLAVAAGDGRSAREAFERGLAVAQRLAEADPGNAQFQRDLSIWWDRFGDLAVAAGDRQAAREAFERGLAVAQRLAEADPGNAELQRALSISWERLGDLAVGAGDGTAAREAFERVLAVRQRLAEADPDSARTLFALMTGHWRLAAAGVDRRANYAAAKAILTRLDSENRLNPVDRKWIAELDAQIAALPPDGS
jgi:tetratricopeptide (TPR) repeat protein